MKKTHKLCGGPSLNYTREMNYEQRICEECLIRSPHGISEEDGIVRPFEKYSKKSTVWPFKK